MASALRQELYFTMLLHEYMIAHSDIDDIELRSRIKQNKISFGGNKRLKIYGLLSCESGKRMKRQNRVFFYSETEAIISEFRPCGHCMNSQYKKWKNGLIHI